MPNALLATNPVILGAGAACGAIILIAFIIGFVKGFRRVSWSGAVWLAAGVAFGLVSKKLPAGDAKQTLLIAGGCILGALVLYGVFSLIFRPRQKWVKKKSDRFTKDKYGIKYDEDVLDYDDYEDYESRKVLVTKGMGTPNIFGRLFGGVICAINVIMILYAVIGGVLLFVSSVELGEIAFLTELLSDKHVLKIKDSAINRWTDVITIGIIVHMACKGYEAGFIDSFRSLVIGLGRLAGFGFSFYLPFSPWAKKGALATYTARFIGVAEKISLDGTVATIVGKVLFGLVLCVLVMIVLALLNKALEKIAEGIENVSLFRVFDGSLSCLIYFALGVAVCAVAWAGLYTMTHYEIIQATDFFTPASTFSNGIYEIVEGFLQKPLSDLKIGK